MEREKRIQKVLSLTLFVILSVFFVDANTSAQERSVFVPARAFSALLVEYNKQNSGVARKTQLVLSEHGMRSIHLSPQQGVSNLVLIKNYHTGQEWLADLDRQAFSELPKGKKVNSSESSVEDGLQLMGVLANRPCLGMTGEQQSSLPSVNETEISTWRCTDQKGRVYLQHYSTLLGVVIRQETQSGLISELQDIALVENTSNLFQPSPGFSKISLTEFIVGSQALPDYVE
ncbi:MAG: hypothetical protein ABW098_17730 [Candidatus Thiodiazotropha sp.]